MHKVVALLLGKEGVDVNKAETATGRTPLLAAIENRHDKVGS